MSRPSLAIVVPVGPQDRAWERLLPMLRDAGARQIVIAATHEDPINHLPEGIRLVRAERGRAIQQNAAAEATNAAWLWFLHADSVIDETSIARLWRFIESGTRGIGFFDLHFHDGPKVMRLNQWGVWFRSRCLKQPFGDQGLVMSRALFFDLSGFDPSITCGEDHALIWKARRNGIPIVPVGAGIGTSARKYVERGWWSTTRHHLAETVRQTMRFSRARHER